MHYIQMQMHADDTCNIVTSGVDPEGGDGRGPNKKYRGESIFSPLKVWAFL